MRIEAQLQLLARIEEALALADAEQAHEVALWLDRARIAAGGPGELGRPWLEAVDSGRGQRTGDGGDALETA